jgi:topoisomerase-4 subunit A
MEIRKEHTKLNGERDGLHKLLGDAKLRWKRLAEEIAATKAEFGAGALGLRRTALGDAVAPVTVTAEAFIEREPVTVILSDKGWLRALKGHQAAEAELKFKEGDRLRFSVACQTTDKLCLFATNGRVYTIKAADLPRGRGDGQPIRVAIELGNEDDVTALMVAPDTGRYLVASSSGRGFVVQAAELTAEKRTGKQIMTLKPGEEAAICVPAEGDHVAVIGEARKLLVFPLGQLPEMARGAGVMLQRYKDGGLADAKVFRLADGLSWRLGEKTRVETDLRPWLGERGQAGKLPPNGFPKSGKFG